MRVELYIITMDGRDPAPPWMVEPLSIMGQMINHPSTGAGFLPSTVFHQKHGWVLMFPRHLEEIRSWNCQVASHVIESALVHAAHEACVGHPQLSAIIFRSLTIHSKAIQVDSP